MRELWWTKWYWDRVFRSTSFLSCQHHRTNVLHTCASNTAVSSRTEGRGLRTDTKQRSFCCRGSTGEVDVHFFMLDSWACTGFSSSNSVFAKSVTYHQGCLLFFVFVLLLSEGQVGESRNLWINSDSSLWNIGIKSSFVFLRRQREFLYPTADVFVSISHLELDVSHTALRNWAQI